MKKLKGIIITGVMLLFIPISAFADAVPWSSTLYTAEAGRITTYNIQSGPVPPVTATWYWQPGFYSSSYANSSITSNSMYVQSTSNNPDLEVRAIAIFSGTYLSNAAPFQFTYDGSYTSMDTSTCSDCYKLQEHYAWLIITDLTANNNVLYYNNSLTLDSSTNIVEIPTIGGHEIKIDFGAKAFTEIELNPNWSTDTVTLNYSMAVAPEPISSVLYISGGALLAGRRYLRKKKKA